LNVSSVLKEYGLNYDISANFAVDDLIDLKSSLKNKIGVYILSDVQNKPLYVGMSTQLDKRVQSHLWGKSNVQEHIHLVKFVTIVCTVNITAAKILEVILIDYLKPPVNKEFLKQRNPKRFNTMVSQRFKLIEEDGLKPFKDFEEGTIEPRLKIVFAERDIKQKDLAKELNESNQTISAWVNGHTMPPLVKAFRLAKLLQCKVADLWSYEELGEE